ncbi:MAG: hypothetical protein WD557_08005 [Dehalococcoidia bacterium]
MVAAGAPADAVQMNKTRLLMMFGAAMMVAGAMLTFAARSQDASAAIPCTPHANTAEELEFLGALQSWRDQNISGSLPLTRSVSLNKAAWHYANFLANTPGAQGHHAEPGYTSGFPWVQRAGECGYDTPAGGEGLAVVEASVPTPVGPSAALSIMAAGQGGGIWVPANVGALVRCVGVGKAVSADGRKTAWVALVMASWEGCPDPDTSLPPATGTSTASTTASTNTPTNTPTKTPTPTPTATPTPVAEFGVTITVCGGWNLLTIPVSGEVDDVFDTAELDVAAIYLQNGETWLRWAPGVPAYARNLSHVSNGDVLWVYRPEPSCEDIEL